MSLENIKRIVITGGPCAGKTTAINNIRTYFEQRDKKIITVEEVPTEIMRMGINYSEFGKISFQKAIIDMQLKKEEVVMEAASSYVDKELMIIYDRGVLDHFIYMNPEEQKLISDELGIDKNGMYSKYDMIIHMLSVASELPSLYENNDYRSEDVSEAKRLDDLIGDIWRSHPDYIRIGCEKEFDVKLNKLINIIENA